jgi:hypothetical protein
MGQNHADDAFKTRKMFLKHVFYITYSLNMPMKAENMVEHGEKVAEKRDRMLEHGFSSERAVVEVVCAQSIPTY